MEVRKIELSLIKTIEIISIVILLVISFKMNRLLNFKYYKKEYRNVNTTATGYGFLLSFFNPEKYFEKDLINEALLIKLINIITLALSIYILGRLVGLI